MITLKFDERKVNKDIDYAGLSLIGFLSLGFLLYYRSFAKLHIYLLFINAPFFIGDMVFVACFSLFCLKWLINPKKASNIAWISLGYFTFVTIKTALGYCLWGPLALRHAVMFYYLFFAVFVYSFYRPVFFGPRKKLALILIFLFIFRFLYFHPYFSMTCLILAVILINRLHAKRRKLVLYILLAFVFPYRLFFDTSRSFLTGNLAAFIYILCGVLVMSKIKRIYKLILSCFFILFMAYGIYSFSSRSDLKSLIGLRELSERFKVLDEIRRDNEKKFIEPKLKVRLYNDKRDTFAQIKVAKRAILEVAKQEKPGVFESDTAKRTDAPAPKVEHKDFFDTKINDPVSGNVGIEQRDINVSYANTLFRIFIWRDAFDELIRKRPVFGFNFGKPFRSHALEVIGWAATEWMVDGWICIHNSYVDLIYRAGIIGLLMIAVIITLLLRFTIISLRNRSLMGILLTGILINWFIAANFLEVMEMPYSAIPLWSLFGLAFAYLFKKKTA